MLNRRRLLEAQKIFHCLKAYRQLLILRKALQEHMRRAQVDNPIETITNAAYPAYPAMLVSPNSTGTAARSAANG